jgi:hypothetical protein
MGRTTPAGILNPIRHSSFEMGALNEMTEPVAR